MFEKRRNVETSKRRSGARCWGIAGRLIVPVLPLVVAGCSDMNMTATDLQMARMDEGPSRFGAHLTNMTDNAILHDMSIADIHFVPHTNELSGTGAARLDRMALLLDTYGGTVRFETTLENENLIALRLDHVREYLDLTGCDMSRVELKVMLSGGRGMPARDVLEARQRVKEEASSPGQSLGTGSFGGGGR